MDLAFVMGDLNLSGGPYPLPSTSTSNAMDCFWVANARTEGTCQACGCGDNTIGHWTRWCVTVEVLKCGTGFRNEK